MQFTGYLGLPSKSHYKVKIWAFGTKSGLFWDHFGTLVPFGTKSRIRDLIGAPGQEELGRVDLRMLVIIVAI